MPNKLRSGNLQLLKNACSDHLLLAHPREWEIITDKMAEEIFKRFQLKSVPIKPKA